MNSKSKAIAAYKAGNIHQVLTIIKHWQGVYSKEERRTIEIAQETKEHAGFYERLGIDTRNNMKKAILIIKKILE